VLRFALRNLFRQGLRTSLTLAAIAFGVAALIVSGGFFRDLLIQLGEATIHSQTGHLQVAKRGYFTSGAAAPERYRFPDQQHARAIMLAQPGVRDVLARVRFSGLISNGRADWPIIGEGIEPDKETRLGTYLQIVAGRALDDRSRFGVMVGEGVADALKLRPGDHVTLLANTDQGALNSVDLDVLGVFRTYSRDYDARAVRISFEAAKDLLGTDATSVLVASLDRTEDTDSVATALRSRFAGRPVEVKTWVELNDFYEKTVDLYRQQFGILQAIMLVMVLLGVANSVNMSMFERVGEFGTMRALGNRSRHVFGQIVVEGAVLGAIGAALGAGIGIGVALALSAIGIPMPPPPNANLGYVATIRVVPRIVGEACLAGFAAAVIASLVPARRLSRMPVVEALRANV